MSDHLPEHLAELLEDIGDGFICVHPHKDELVSKLRTILAAAWAVGDMNGRVVIPRYSDMTYTNKCAFCGRGMGQLCANDCPHRQLREALGDE